MSDPYDALIVTMFGGPGVGKSTTAADIFARLKWTQVSVEMVQEYAKGKVYEESMRTLDHQIYVFGKQLHYVKRCAREVDVVVQDASLLNSLIYKREKTSETFKRLVREEYERFDNFNIYIERDHPYDSEGRYQTREEALKLDARIERKLEELGLNYIKCKSGPENVGPLIREIQGRV